MSPTVTFRELSMEDLNEVMEIEEQSFTTPWSRYAFMHEIQFDKSFFEVIKVEGKVVGYGGFWHLLDEAHISTIAIHPDYRCRGFGRKLLTRMLEAAVTCGALRASLEVRRSNTAARRMYESFGFVVAGVRKNYYSDDREDALIMWNNDIPHSLAALAGRKMQQETS